MEATIIVIIITSVIAIFAVKFIVEAVMSFLKILIPFVLIVIMGVVGLGVLQFNNQPNEQERVNSSHLSTSVKQEQQEIPSIEPNVNDILHFVDLEEERENNINKKERVVQVSNTHYKLY